MSLWYVAESTLQKPFLRLTLTSEVGIPSP